jgi:oligopeptide/dipeptide ABC transporter ATP-binding protein
MRSAAPPLLRVRGLKTRFPTRKGLVRAVDGVSFDLEAGETLGVVGESGCGKSVTALSLVRLVAPPGRVVAGEIVFEGRDLLKLSDGDLRHVRGGRIGFIFQDPMTSLNPLMTVGDQIMESVLLHTRKRGAEARSRTVELLDLVGIPSAARRVGNYPHEFSGGMRQRVMIAVAIACNPALLIADEPTTALDVTIQAQILDLMRDLQRELGMAVILISHDLGVVAQMCARVAVMYAGRIVESAPTRALFEAPAFPYTQGLMLCRPQRRVSGARLMPISGAPPNLAEPIVGCAFLPRCGHAESACRDGQPELQPVDGADHLSACLVVQRDGHAALRERVPVA